MNYLTMKPTEMVDLLLSLKRKSLLLMVRGVVMKARLISNRKWYPGLLPYKHQPNQNQNS